MNKQALDRLKALSENAYIAYIESLRRTECLGEEIKMERGQFHLPELDAHRLAAEWLGRHRAYARAVEIIEQENP